ncbi:TPA: AAA family ATPase [Klebsiella aerogenes]|nr:AAA family ATPase [Klebsiella aerogenes]
MSSKQLQRIIITGGPGSGKSTLISKLSHRGYKCFPEAGRGIIQNQVSIGGNALPWGDRGAFAEFMLCWEMRSWSEAEEYAEACFYDRGIPDVAGYLRLINHDTPDYLENAIAKFRYNQTVFIAPPWREIFAQDAERKQSFEEAVLTYHSMIETYQQYGYQLLELPCIPAEDRADFILSKIAT